VFKSCGEVAAIAAAKLPVWFELLASKNERYISNVRALLQLRDLCAHSIMIISVSIEGASSSSTSASSSLHMSLFKKIQVACRLQHNGTAIAIVRSAVHTYVYYERLLQASYSMILLCEQFRHRIQ
jgi:hypothetical protein